MDTSDHIQTEAEDTPVASGRPRQLWLFPASRPLAERFGVEFFRSVPECPGVYLMCGITEGVLYVGKARNLRRRLGSYRSAHPGRVSRKIQKLLATVSRIYWDECDDEASAIGRERELLLTLRPKFNTVGTYPAPHHYVGWRHSGEELFIGFSRTAEDWDRSYGQFTRIKPVYAALLRLVWRALHPSEQIHQLPLPLTTDSPPPVSRFNESRHSGAASLEEIVQRLDEFFSGARSSFLDMLPELQSASPFANQAEDSFHESCLFSPALSPAPSGGENAPDKCAHCAPELGRDGALRRPRRVQRRNATPTTDAPDSFHCARSLGEDVPSLRDGDIAARCPYQNRVQGEGLFFAQQWIEADRLCLQEFHERHFGSGKGRPEENAA